MIETAPTVLIKITFQDRNNNKGRTQAYLPFVVSDSTVEAFLALYMPKLQALSNATIVAWSATWSARDDHPGAPAPDSDVSQNLVSIYRSGELYDWLWIPSPRSDLLEQSGEYAGIRLDSLRPEVAAILDDWQDVVTFITNNQGEPFPIEFSAAGLAL